MIRKNDVVLLEITDISSEGNGVGRFEGMAVFVPMTAPGDRILVRIAKVQKSFAYGILQEIQEPSPLRAPNDCPVYRQCGGCALRHLSYKGELAAKAGWVEENLRRIGGIAVQCEPIIPSPQSGRYRNKAQYPIRMVDGRVRAGFFARRSHRLVPVEDCLLQPAGFCDILRCVTSFMEEFQVAPYDEQAHSGVVRHVFIREAEATGQVMVWLVVNAGSLPHAQELAARLRAVCPGLASFGFDCNRRRTNVIFGGEPVTVWGSGTITDVLCGVRLALSPLSFYQINRRGAEQLFRTALEYADPAPGDTLLDLYCGAGAVGLSMAHRVRELIGVEIVPQAVENACANAAQNGIANVRFLCADAAQAARRLAEEGVQPDIVVLDPPRKGADAATLDCIRALSPQKVVYISCNSATLARDARMLAGYGYRVQRVRPVDLFPRTANVECCCLLTKMGCCAEGTKEV